MFSLCRQIEKLMVSLNYIKSDVISLASNELFKQMLQYSQHPPAHLDIL